MQGQSGSISVFHITLLAMTAIGLKNHVTIIPFLIETAGRDAWISVIVTVVPTFIWILLLLYIHRRTDQGRLFDWVKKEVGKIPAFLFSLAVCIYFTFLIASTLKETITWTSVSYLPNTPPLFLTLLLCLLCFYLTISGIRALAIANFFILFFVIVFGFFVAITNLQFKDYSLLKPFLEHGLDPVISGMIYSASGLAEITAFIFLQHKVYKPFRFKHYAVNVIILTWLTLGPLLGAIAEFGPTEAARQRYPAYEEWTLVRLTQYIEHVDFLSIYQWLSGAFIRISLYLYIMTEMFQAKTKWFRPVLIIVTLSIATWFTLNKMNDETFYHLLKVWFLPFTVFASLLFSFVLGLFVLVSRKIKQR